jgi:hypothetical protein
MVRIIMMLFFILSCSRMNNHHAEDLVLCGDDLDRGQAYFTIWSAGGGQMTSGFEVVDLESQKSLDIITKNGCVARPESGRFLIRSLVPMKRA